MKKIIVLIAIISSSLGFSQGVDIPPSFEDFATDPNPNLASMPNAPIQPTRNAWDVISIYSNAYANVPNVDYYPNWGQGTTFEVNSDLGDPKLHYSNLDYQGISFAEINISSMTKLHLDIWTSNITQFKFSLIGGGENGVTLTPTLSGWNSYDIDLSTFVGVNLNAIFQIKLEKPGFAYHGESNSIYIDNIYFWKPSSIIQNLCTKTIKPYNVNVGDALHNGSTYAWSLTPEAPNAVIVGNSSNAITIDWTNVPDGSYTLQAIETSVTGCVSTAVTAVINLSAIAVPVAQPQTFCTDATVANLVATGTNLQWYTNPTGGAALDSIAILTTGTYYVSQTLGTCESSRTLVSVIVSPQTTPTFTPIASTCSGETINPLTTISINGITGTWSPELNNNVTTTYTFTPDAGQCATTASQTITITAPKVTSPISFVAPPEPAAILPSVTIGTQIWTNKNLDISTYRDGTPIPQVTDPTQWANLTTGAWCYYNNDSAMGEVYGKLYNWYAVAGIYSAESLINTSLRKQLAPIGWHVPSDIDWLTIMDYLGGENIAGGKMKEIGTTHWNYPNRSATNISGFTGIPGGYRDIDGSYSYVGYYAYLWSLSEVNTSNSWGRLLDLNYGIAGRPNSNKTFGFSVRLIKD